MSRDAGRSGCDMVKVRGRCLIVLGIEKERLFGSVVKKIGNKVAKASEIAWPLWRQRSTANFPRPNADVLGSTA